ncbi:MAG: M14 family zinc carboxypeptidase [bacterium]|nr:M14 family zinc carboxypeptidase [bacterium]
MKKFIFIGAGILFFSFVYAEQQPYILAKVNIVDLAKIQDLGLDVVKVYKGDQVEFVTQPVQISEIKARGVSVDILIEDMEKYYSTRMSKKGANFGNFYTYSEANNILDSLHTLYPNITTARISIGKTWGNNDIWAMKISDNPDSQENEKEVYFDALHHAREPVGVNIVVEFVRYLCKNYAVDSEITDLVNNLQIWVVPMVNPDGYLYNEANYPNGGGMWRKNRHGSGIDINRNYGYEWGYDNVGSSPDSTSESYRGTAPFSEPETQHIRDFCNQHKFVTALNYHSYAGILLFPWGYRKNYTDDDSLFRRMGGDMTAQNGYVYGTVPDILYTCNGGSIDWFYGEQTTKPKILTLSPEVNGSGFWDEASISTNIQECLPMNLYLLRFARNSVWKNVGVLYKSYTIRDSLGNNNGITDPGESINLLLYIKNSGDTTAYGVTGILTSMDSYVNIQDSIKSFGDILKGDSSSAEYRFTIASNCPNSHQINFNLLCKDNKDSSWSSNFHIKVGLEWANHDTGNSIFTVTCRGICGFTELGGEGSGFIYPKVGGQNSLSVGSLWVGNSENWVANRDYDADSNKEWEATLNPNGGMQIGNTHISDQDIWGMYEDTTTGIRVQQNSWAWGDSSYQDFVIMEYIIRNNSDSVINGIYAGQFMDFDIGSGGNRGAIDSTRRLVYMWGSGLPYSGVKILEPKSARNLSFIKNGTYVIPNSYVLDFDKFKFLNGNIKVSSTSQNSDWSIIASAGPFALQPDSSFKFVIAVIGGDTVSDIKKNADSAQSKYDNMPIISVEEITLPSKVILYQNLPNPFHNKTMISYRSISKGRVSLKVYDLCGRVVETILDEEQFPGVHKILWSIKNKLSAGVYFYRLESKKFKLTKKMILL